jgi:UDP-glucose 4-epimerase
VSPGLKLNKTIANDAEAGKRQQVSSRPGAVRILLTGGSGSLGRAIASRIERDPETDLYLPNRAEWGQIHEYAAIARPHVVVHSAACGLRYPKPDYFEMAAVNAEATLRLFEAVPDAHFIYISTGLAYLPQGRPLTEDDPLGSLDAYASTKAAADLMLRAAASACGRSLTVVRPFCFSGLHDGGGRLFPSLLCAAMRGVPFSMSPGLQVRDYCAVQDVAEAICTIVRRGPQQPIEIFNIGSGAARPLGELVEHVCHALELEVELRFGERPYAPHEPMHLVADAERARRQLGWEPRTSFDYAVWQLARSAFPALKVSRPQ